MIFLLLISGFALSAQYDIHNPLKSIKEIIHIRPFGWYIWKTHYLSAQLLLILIPLHIARTLTKDVQRITGKWVTGLALFTLVVAETFSGYLLRGDAKAKLANTVLVHLLNIKILNNSYLLYTVHTTLIPWLLIITMAVHFYYVRKKTLEGQEQLVPIEQLVKKEAMAAMAAIAVINTLTLIIPIPALKPYDPLNISGEKAVWFFRPVQNLLKMLPTTSSLLVITMVFLFLLGYPLVKGKRTETAYRIILLCIATCILILTFI